MNYGTCCDRGNLGEPHDCCKTPPEQPANSSKSGFPSVEHQFKPGQSGNPSGRPKKRLIDELLTELLESAESADAVEIAKSLIAMAKKDHKAAQLVAERTQGKPSQRVEHTGEDGGPIKTRLIVEFVDPE